MNTKDSGAEVKSRKGKGVDSRNLLLQHLEGHADAFPALLEQCRKPVYSYLRRCGIDSAGADDVFQEIFIKVHKSAGSYDKARALNPWLFTIVANTVRSHFRKHKAQQSAEQHLSAREAQHAEDAHSHGEAKETAAWIFAEIEKLPLEQREALLLSTTVSMDQKEISEVLGKPIATVRTLLHRARLQLTEALARRNLKLKGEHSR